ncbi:hypothetical protein KP509_21G056700 [Ceratopteris richardii]|nr:hypothetical protein KP509_21G056700 [Ceratopteris richardii]KAH7315597.1 hypothetical protein KP509_21G056700 [Ceratopteris richardii]
MDRRRAALEIYEVSGMFKQARISFRASLPLFMALALLASLYETAVEQSSLLSGLSLSGQSSNFSFQFALDSKTQASHSPPKADLKKFEVPGSWLSHIFAGVLPLEDQAPQPMNVKQGQMEGSLENAGHTNTDSQNSEGNLLDSQSLQEVEGLTESSLTQADSNDSEASRLSILENPKETQGGRRTFHEVESAESFDKSEGGGVDASHVSHDSNSEGQKRAMMISEIKTSSTEDRTGVDHQDSLEYDMQFSSRESAEAKNDVDINLPHLKVENTSNMTKKVMQESVIDAIDVSFFTGKLLGGRLDQGAFPQGGFSVILVLLLIAVVITVVLAIVAFHHAAMLGSIAYSVVSTHMGKRVSAGQALKSSLRWSIGRLIWLSIVLAAASGIQSLFFMKTFFNAVLDMEQVEALVLRLSATPFAILAPFYDADAASPGMAVRIGLFVCCDYLFDAVTYCIYIVACWVTILERNLWGFGAVVRSCNLIKGMESQALMIRIIEAMICGRTSRWLLQHVIGQFAAVLVISTAHVYFLVLWLIFYMSARSLHDRPSHFSHRILEDFLDRLH